MNFTRKHLMIQRNANTVMRQAGVCLARLQQAKTVSARMLILTEKNETTTKCSKSTTFVGLGNNYDIFIWLCNWVRVAFYFRGSVWNYGGFVG